MVNLKKLILHSSYPAFKNNGLYKGSFVISGTVVPGTNIRSFTIPLPKAPDIGDLQFQGRGEVGFSTPNFQLSRRPTAGWFKSSFIFVRGDNAGMGYNNYPCLFTVGAQISGASILVTLTCVQQFGGTMTLTPETVNYRLADYINT